MFAIPGVRAVAALGLVLVTATSIVVLRDRPTPAVQLPDGTIHFAQPPRLVDTVANFRATYTPNTIYYFTLDIPAEAGEPLQRVAITKTEGGGDIYYRLDRCRAFEGTFYRKGNGIAIAEMIVDRETGTVSFVFDPPIPPGKTITLGLRSLRNPNIPGVYLFGITAFPAGEQPSGQFLGFGRIHFNRHRGGGA